MEIIDVPKSHELRHTRVREATREYIDAHLLTHIGDICVRYMYHPTFPGMSCFRTCGVLRMPLIGNVTTWPHLTAFHNARCPQYPDQCIRCGVHIMQRVNTECADSHDAYSQLPQSITDQPFITHNRAAMIEFGILGLPHIVVLGMTFGVSCILSIIILKIQRHTGNDITLYPLFLTTGTVAKWIITRFYSWIV